MGAAIAVSVMREGRPAQGRLGDKSPVSVIDIGSNSVRLVVYEGAVRSPTPLFNEKVLCGLGRSVASNGRLEGEGVTRALEALRRFRSICEMLGAGKPWVLATAAVREAENGAAFVRDVEKACKATVMLLSGKREAELAAAGIVSAFPEPDGLTGDLGGGSLELIDIKGARLRDATTLQLGGLRLLKRSDGDLGRADRIIGQELAQVGWLDRGRGRDFFAVGGTWRNIARLHMTEYEYPLHVTHGYSMDPETALKFCEALGRGKKLSSKARFDDLPSARREVIPLGAMVLKRIIERIAPSRIVFSVFGIREGLLYTLLPVRERIRDPLLSFCEDYARLRARSPVHAQELCAWTDRLFRDGGPREAPAERRLRHAACLISDISWRAHPDYRGEQSLNVIAHAALSGIDHPGRAFLALTVYFRHTGIGRDELSGRLIELVSKGDLKRARIIGAAIRTAHMLSVGTPGVIEKTPLSYEGRKLVLSIPRELAPLDGERLRKRLGILAELVGCTGEVRLVK